MCLDPAARRLGGPHAQQRVGRCVNPRLGQDRDGIEMPLDQPGDGQVAGTHLGQHRPTCPGLPFGGERHTGQPGKEGADDGTRAGDVVGQPQARLA